MDVVGCGLAYAWIWKYVEPETLVKNVAAKDRRNRALEVAERRAGVRRSGPVPEYGV
jgi:hypothetical protein